MFRGLSGSAQVYLIEGFGADLGVAERGEIIGISAAIEVCSTTGTTLRRGRGTIDCSTLPHGIYIIKATDGKTTLTRKIVF